MVLAKQEVKSVLLRSGLFSQSLSWFLLHELSTGIPASPLTERLPQANPAVFRRLARQFADNHLYSWMERGIVRVMYLVLEINIVQCAYWWAKPNKWY